MKKSFIFSIILLVAIACKEKENNMSKTKKDFENSEERIRTLPKEKGEHQQNLEEISFSINEDSLPSQSQKITNIYNFTFYLPTELEEWYGKNYKKGEPSKKWVIGEFYSHPTSKSTKIGKLLAYFNPKINNFVLQFTSIDGTVKSELTEIGDWGYGIHINVITVAKQFVKVPNAYFNKTVWLHFNKDTDHIENVIFGHHSSYVQQLVSLPKILVTTTVTKKQASIEAGVYYIESYLNGSFTIRKEIPEDMPCGEEIDLKTDKKSLKRYLLKINDLKDKNGNYQIRLAYTKGC